MFEKIVLRREEDGPAYTLGSIGEAMLYYQNVHLVLDWETINLLLEQLSGDELFVLLERPGASASFVEHLLSTRTRKASGIEHYDFAGMQIVRTASGTDVGTTARLLEHVLTSHGYAKRRAGALAAKLLQKIRPLDLFGKKIVPGGLQAVATEDVFDSAYMPRAIYEVVRRQPGWPEDHKFPQVDVFKTQQGFHAVSNIDFATINHKRANSPDNYEPLTMAHLLTEVLSARADLSLAAHFGGDFRTSETRSALIQLRARELMRRAHLNENQIVQFNDVIYDGAPSLSEVVDSGGRTFSELMNLLDKAALFKKWVANQHPDAILAKEYFEQTSKEGPLESLPAKVIRYVVGALLDTASPLASKAFGLADAFVLDKISKGWRPNHFVERRLKPFSGGE